MIDVAIIGAGPYGLSIAAHLKERRLEFRIFGRPMQTWRTQMPEGMHLKSEGFASNLYEPSLSFSLEAYCRQHKLPYAPIGLPVSLQTFVSYGLAFQKKFVPALEDKLVLSVREAAKGFEILLEDGESFLAKRVIVAVGISHFAYRPPLLADLPTELSSHSSGHNELGHFSGRDVTVVGAGASALDLAALLHQAGASVQLVARAPSIHFHEPPGAPWTFRANLRHLRKGLGEGWSYLHHPRSGLGVGWGPWFSVHAPLAFHRLPERTRLDFVQRTLGPAPGWFVKDAVVGKVAFNLGEQITQATGRNGQVCLELTDRVGARRILTTSHVIAATGYRVDLERLGFLDSSIRSKIRTIERAPNLSTNFESSVPGLYFVGTSAANAFGPLMRFAFGARFTARRVSRHLARKTSPRPERVAEASVRALHGPQDAK